MALEGNVSAMSFEMSQKLADATKKDYRYRIDYFYKNSMVKSDAMLIHMPTTELQVELREFTLHLLERVSKKELSANSVPKYFKPLKWMLDTNGREGEIKWKSLESLFPRETKKSGYKAWSTEELQKIIDHVKQIRDKSLIHFMASTGARVGIHNQELLIRHLVPMEWHNEKCYAVLVYADDDETVEEKEIRDGSTFKNDDVQSGDSYWTFLTPEATLYLDEYFESRKLHGDQLHPDSPIFLSYVRHCSKNRQMSDKTVSHIMQRSVALANISRHKKGHRNDVQINHGLRKRFNTIVKLEAGVNSNIAEKILGHRNGLDGVYLTPTRQQCFDEFVKAIEALTVSSAARKQIKIKQLQEEATETSKMISNNDDMLAMMLENPEIKEKLVKAVLESGDFKKLLGM